MRRSFATIFIGQAVGGNDFKKSFQGYWKYHNSFYDCIGGAYCISCYAGKARYKLMSTPEDAVSGIAAYLTICFIGIPFITAYNVLSAFFRDMGDSKSLMYFIAVACFANNTS